MEMLEFDPKKSGSQTLNWKTYNLSVFEPLFEKPARFSIENLTTCRIFVYFRCDLSFASDSSITVESGIVLRYAIS